MKDRDYVRYLAIYMLNEKLMRVGDEIEAVPAGDAQLAAAALLFYNVQIAREQRNTSAIQSVMTLLGRDFNGLKQFIEPVQAYARGETDTLPFDEVDTGELKYCLDRAGG